MRAWRAISCPSGGVTWKTRSNYSGIVNVVVVASTSQTPFPHRAATFVAPMIEPRYQEIQSNDIASTAKNGVEVRIIAGESMGVQSPVYTRTPTMYLDFKLRQSAHLRQPIPPTWNSFVYVLEGEGVFCSERSAPVGPHHLLLLGQGDGLEVWNRSSKPLRFVLIGGEPLGEPVAQLGPFVMNTEEEIDRTIDDYQYFVNGFEKAKYWRSAGMASP